MKNIAVYGASDRQLQELLPGRDVKLRFLHTSELLALAQQSAVQPELVILDIRDSDVLPPTLASLRRQHPRTPVIIIARRMDPTLMLEAMRVGVSEWLSDPLVASELQAALDRVLSVAPPTVQGKTFAFVGAKGGVGTTTMATNVAAALAKGAPADRVLLLDLHLSYGDAAVFLGAEPRFSVVDALENTHRLDEAFFDTLVVKTKSGVELLASSERAVGGAEIRRTSALLQFVASRSRFTILDVPRSEAAALDALEGVSTVVIVANQELATVRNAGRMAAALRQRYGKEHVCVVVTRFDPHAEIGRDDVQRVTGAPVAHVIPSDYRAALSALNRGRPLTLDPEQKLGRAFQQLAFELAGIKPERVVEVPKGPGLLGRLTGKRS
jgi:pilus assembly protein CpaE